MPADVPQEGPEIHDGRLRLRSRRGMLELELALGPFVAERLGTLGDADKRRYARLLDNDDWDIFDWLQGRLEIPDADLAHIVEQIRAANPGL
jgi:antitoxin CptB